MGQNQKKLFPCPISSAVHSSPWTIAHHFSSYAQTAAYASVYLAQTGKLRQPPKSWLSYFKDDSISQPSLGLAAVINEWHAQVGLGNRVMWANNHKANRDAENCLVETVID